LPAPGSMDNWHPDPAAWEDVSALFEKAVEDRSVLDSTPEEVRAAVEDLLKFDGLAGRFLEQPAVAPLDFLAGDGVPENAQAGRLVARRYLLEKEIGRGGAGTVYLARDRNVHDRQVVVKLLHSHWLHSSWMRVRFRQESEALARLRHPGIVEILDVGESDGGELFLVMPYWEGTTLRAALSQGAIERDRGAAILVQICDALETAHASGILHRDLKPENVLLVQDSDGERAILLDFGIAKLQNPGEPDTTTLVIGTTQYMAPEQFYGKSSAGSDVYAMAVLAHEMFTGVLPSETIGAPVKLDRIAHLPLRRVLKRGLSTDPARRPTSAAAFGRDLLEAVNDPGISRRKIAAGGLALAVSSALGWRWYDSRPLSENERRIEYAGAGGPLKAGFTPNLDIGWTALQNDNRTGYDRIRLESGSQGYYSESLTPRQIAQAFRRGWRLRAEYLSEAGLTSCNCNFATVRFDMELIRVPGERYCVGLIRQIEPLYVHERIPLDDQPGAFHVFELVYDPATKVAELFVDGVKKFSAYRGHTQYCENRGLMFGTALFGKSVRRSSGVLKSISFDIFS
jgi:tRNA A-37 threonylcarbamoyl transferase component Bud32